MKNTKIYCRNKGETQKFVVDSGLTHKQVIALLKADKIVYQGAVLFIHF